MGRKGRALAAVAFCAVAFVVAARTRKVARDHWRVTKLCQALLKQLGYMTTNEAVSIAHTNVGGAFAFTIERDGPTLMDVDWPCHTFVITASPRLVGALQDCLVQTPRTAGCEVVIRYMEASQLTVELFPELPV